jgi:prepilin-type N-terminal cleavage/methylation domain-containing protein
MHRQERGLGLLEMLLVLVVVSVLLLAMGRYYGLVQRQAAVTQAQQSIDILRMAAVQEGIQLSQPTVGNAIPTWAQRGVVPVDIAQQGNPWGGELVATVALRQLTVRMTRVPTMAGRSLRTIYDQPARGVRAQYEQHLLVVTMDLSA